MRNRTSILPDDNSATIHCSGCQASPEEGINRVKGHYDYVTINFVVGAVGG